MSSLKTFQSDGATPRQKPLPPASSSVQVSWTEPLLDIVYALVASKFLVISILFAGVFIGVIRLKLMPETYRSSAVAILMSREKPMFDVAIDTNSIETSDDRANRSTAGSLMLPPDPSLYTTLIMSRGVIEQLWLRHKEDLMGDLSPDDRSEEVYAKLRSMITVNSTEEGLITISVTSENPNTTAILANELFAECERASKAIERQLILQQAGHLEKALVNSQERLFASEKELDGFSATYGLIDLQLQAENKLRSQRELQAERDGLLTDLQELQFSYAEKSPEVQRVRSRINAIERQIRTSGQSMLTGVDESEYGGLSVAHESLKQRVQFERDLVGTLSTKADIYRIRAEQPTGNLAIILRAQVPTKPAGPSKKKELGLALFVSIFTAFGVAIAKWQLSTAFSDPRVQNRVQRICRVMLANTPLLCSESGSAAHSKPTSARLPLLMPPFNPAIRMHEKENG